MGHGLTLERARPFRAILTCTTCRVVVAVGPAAEYEPRAAFELGIVAGAAAVHHLGVCAGGALDVAIEDLPYETGTSSSPVPYETEPGAGRAARGLKPV